MRIHAYLQGGSHDGEMFSMLGPEAKGEIRVATADAVPPLRERIDLDSTVPVEVYTLISADRMERLAGGQMLAAAYRWVGQRESSIHLIDVVLE